MMSTNFTQSKSLELKKHVSTIHSSNHLTLLQRKVANALLYNAYESLMEKDEHSIHINTLCRLIGYDSKDYKKIKDALIALISTVIEWNLIDKDRISDEMAWRASSIIADASIDGASCSYSYSNKMRQLLYRPELYGRLNMQVQAKFKSTYGLALYENCIRYQNIQQTPWFELKTFRKLMGVEEGKYIIFRDFKRRVVDKAVCEVNKNSPITVSVSYKKEGRNVVALQFLISRAQYRLDNKVVIEKQSTGVGQILSTRYGLSGKQASDCVTQYEEKYILDKIAIIESSASFQNGKIINLAKYLIKALQDDFQPPKSSYSQVVKSHDFQKEQQNKSIKMREKQLNEYRKYQIDTIQNKYEVLSADEKLKIEKSFKKDIEKTILNELFQKEGFENPLVLERFTDFIRLNKGDLVGVMMGFPDFLKFKWPND